MADLTPQEKRAFKRVLAMGDGYVLNFTNRTFEEFVTDSTGRMIYDSRYDYSSGSKANRLRGFWRVESNPVAAKLLGDLLDYAAEHGAHETDPHFASCRRAVTRLRQSGPVPEIELALLPGQDFDALTGQVREAIEKNQPEVGLDRLHTYVVKYVRTLCTGRGIPVPQDKPLHSLFGEYVKQLKAGGQIESAMTERILKSSIATLEAFNQVRNTQSFAHDNPILNYEESLLIFNHVTSLVRFVRVLEGKLKGRGRGAVKPPHTAEEIPF